MRTIRVRDKVIGGSHPAFIVAEAGINHNGSVEIARRLIDAAARAGADAIKFQAFHTDLFLSRSSKYYSTFKRLELSEDDFRDLAKHAWSRGLSFIVTPLDLEYVDILDEIGVDAFKVASSDITYFPLFDKLAEKKKPVIVSTGMAEVNEIYEAVRYLESRGLADIAILHCISCYPTPYEEANLRSIVYLGSMFDHPVGYSDHTLGIDIPVAAVVLGAKIIEKHFTLSKEMEGPDHKLSADPVELREMIKRIRFIEKAMGGSWKKPSPCELETRIHARRSIAARQDLEAGEKITREKIICKRPGTGIEPKYLRLILGKKIKRRKKADSIIEWNDVLEE